MAGSSLKRTLATSPPACFHAGVEPDEAAKDDWISGRYVMASPNIVSMRLCSSCFSRDVSSAKLTARMVGCRMSNTCGRTSSTVLLTVAPSSVKQLPGDRNERTMLKLRCDSMYWK